MREIVEAQMELITGHIFNIIMTKFSKLVRIKPYKERNMVLSLTKIHFMRATRDPCIGI